MTERIIYMIQPWKPYFGDSGQINGLSGRGGYHSDPITDDDGNWLMFDSYEEAEAEAIKLGYGRGDVSERKLTRIEPNAELPILSEWSHD